MFSDAILLQWPLADTQWAWESHSSAVQGVNLSVPKRFLVSTLLVSRILNDGKCYPSTDCAGFVIRTSRTAPSDTCRQHGQTGKWRAIPFPQKKNNRKRGSAQRKQGEQFTLIMMPRIQSIKVVLPRYCRNRNKSVYSPGQHSIQQNIALFLLLHKFLRSLDYFLCLEAVSCQILIQITSSSVPAYCSIILKTWSIRFCCRPFTIERMIDFTYGKLIAIFFLISIGIFSLFMLQKHIFRESFPWRKKPYQTQTSGVVRL